MVLPEQPALLLLKCSKGMFTTSVSVVENYHGSSQTEGQITIDISGRPDAGKI